jgi:hypothetical protein
MRISPTFIKIFIILSFLVVLLNLAGFAFNFYNAYFGYALLAIAFVWLFLIFRKQEAGFWFELPKYVFLLLLLLVTLSSLKFDFINNIGWLQSFIGFLKSYQLFLTIATIAIGALVFWMNRDVVEEVEKEKEDEEAAERRRYEEFDRRFPRLSRIWGLRNIVRWCYKEGWWYVAGWVLILGLYLFVQFSMFQYSGNYPDEYRHILTGKSLVNAGEFPILSNSYGDQGYLRGAPLSYKSHYSFQYLERVYLLLNWYQYL